MNKETIGRYAFIGGLVISVLVGALQITNPLVAPVLVILGLIVGFLNVRGEEVQKFLLGTIALILVGTALKALPAIGPMATSIIEAFVSFVAGAALLVALKEVYTITKSK